MAAGSFYMLWLNGFSALPSFNPNWYSVVGDFAVSAPIASLPAFFFVSVPIL
jgi:hypothetical protein